jgi:DNA-binding HxlR family transcriptional regulator
MATKKSKTDQPKCTIDEIMAIIGGKWSIPIIYNLFSGTKRFKELERSLPNINTRMLIKELKNLEHHGVVMREAFATIPPTVEYSLTVKGKELEKIILSLYAWGQKHFD